MSFDLHTSVVQNYFIQKCVHFISEHLDDERFSIVQLASHLNVSKPTFYRRIKSMTGLNTRDFIRNIKMQIAYQMLQTRSYTVSEVAWRCGYSSARHFSKIFFAVFKQYPSRVF